MSDEHLDAMPPRLREWAKQDRQWPRALRIAHARHQLMRASTAPDKTFWAEVLRANGAR